MIAKLYSYFGIVGIASILLWAAAAVLLCVHLRGKRRHIHYFRALGLILLATVLAHINSARVSAIETDRSEEIEAQRQVLQRIRLDAGGSSALTKRFAEDAPGEEEGLAPGPSYRALGKQKREAGKVQEIIKGSPEEATERAPVVRTMKETDVIRANQLDRYNLFAVRFLLLFSLGLIAWDYIRRFNKTDEPYYPLPITGHWLDSHFAKSHSVRMAPAAEAAMPRLMELAVRKGETFLYFGVGDPWESAGSLPRVQIRQRALWSLRKVVYGVPPAPSNSEFFFNAVWFGRYCVVVQGLQEAQVLLGHLESYLETRHLTRAVAARTVNLVWALPTPPPSDRVARLLLLCRETNFRIFLTPPPESHERFDETYPAA